MNQVLELLNMEILHHKLMKINLRFFVEIQENKQYQVEVNLAPVIIDTGKDI